MNAEDESSIIDRRPTYVPLGGVGGEEAAKEEATVKLPQMENAVTGLVMPEAPNLASMGRMVEDMGWSVAWKKGRFQMWDPKGRLATTKVSHYTPQFVDEAKVMAVYKALSAEDRGALMREYFMRLPAEKRDGLWNEYQGKNIQNKENDEKGTGVIVGAYDADTAATPAAPATSSVEGHPPVDGHDKSLDAEAPKKHPNKLIADKLDDLMAQVRELVSGDEEGNEAVKTMEVAVAGLKKSVKAKVRPKSRASPPAAGAPLPPPVVKQEKESSDEVTGGKKRPRRLPKRRRHNKLRYAAATGNEAPDDDHFLLHDKADPKCPACEHARAAGAPAVAATGKQPSGPVPTRARERVHADLLTPEEEDINGHVAALITECQAMHYPRAMTLPDKESETVLGVYRVMYPGSVRAGTFPETTATDNGPEFRSAFREGIAAAGGGHITSVPNRPQSNARIERLIQEIEKGVAACMYHARAPYKLWGYGIRHWCFNKSRTRADPDDPKSTPFYGTYEKEHEETLFPFCCGCSYRDEDYQKFGPRQRDGIAVGYGTQHSVIVMDAEDFFTDGKARFITTPSVQLHKDVFPFKERGHEMPDLAKFTSAFTQHFRQRLEVQEAEYDRVGRLICPICKKLKTTDPVTCVACNTGVRHDRKGRPGPGCLRSRCPGHDENKDQGEPTAAPAPADYEDEEAVVPVGAPPSPRMRMRRKDDPAQFGIPPPRRTTVTVQPSGDIDVVMEEPEPALHTSPSRANEGGIWPPAAPATPPPTATQLQEDPVVGMPMMGAAIRVTVPTNANAASGRTKRGKVGTRVHIPHNPEDVTAVAGSREEIFQNIMEVRFNLSEQESEFYESAKKAMAYVTRVISVRSEEAKNSVAAQEAIAAEMRQVTTELKTFDLSKVRSWREVARCNPRATRVRGFMILGEQHAELPKEQRRMKARLVGGGDNLLAADGEKVVEVLNQMTPASLDAFRVVSAYSLGCPQGVLLKGDVRGAYLKTEMIGEQMFLSLEKELWPDAWSKLPYDDPCVPLDGALYGVSRAGYAWGWRARKDLVKAGFKWVRDIGEDSIYFKPSDVEGEPGAMVVLYSDDFATGGPSSVAEPAHAKIDELFGFSSKSGEDRTLTEFLSMHRVELPMTDDGVRRCQLGQVEYAKAIVEKYKARRGLRTLRHYITPMPQREEGEADDYVKKLKKEKGAEAAQQLRAQLSSLGIADVAEAEELIDTKLFDTPGEMASSAAEHVGGLLWLARGTRPDITTATQTLSGRLTKWSAYEDKLLERLFGYIEHTAELVLEQAVHPGDFSQLAVVGHMDADHGGDLVTTKARSGWAISLDGPRSHALTGWSTKTQTGTGKSTGDNEVTAISDAVSTNMESTRCCLEQVMARTVLLIGRTDADAALGAIRKGYSRKMSYLRRTQRVSIGFLHDFWSDPHSILSKVASKSNDSDVLTKSLDKHDHWRHSWALGMRMRAASQPITASPHPHPQ